MAAYPTKPFGLVSVPALIGISLLLNLLIGLPWILLGVLILTCLVLGVVTLARLCLAGRQACCVARRPYPDGPPARAAAPYPPRQAPAPRPAPSPREDSFMRPALMTGLLLGLMAGIFFSTFASQHGNSSVSVGAQAVPQVAHPPAETRPPVAEVRAPVAEPEKPAEVVADKGPPWTVEGSWPNHDGAMKDALQHAQAKVIAYLRSQNPPVLWTPSIEYVQSRLIKKPWKEEIKNAVVAEKTEAMHYIRLEVEISPKDHADMLRLAREERVHERMFFLGKILAGVVVLLLGVAGYLRLDEQTKGYYTGWLRLATVGLLGVALAGLFLIA